MQVKQNEAGEWFIESNGVWKKAGSSYEVNYALALLKFGWDAEYLAGWWIGAVRKLEIDFRVFTIPKITWVFIDGAVWHAGNNANVDRWEREMLYAYTRNFAWEPIAVLNPDCETLEAAEAHVARTFGRH